MAAPHLLSDTSILRSEEVSNSDRYFHIFEMPPNTPKSPAHDLSRSGKLVSIWSLLHRSNTSPGRPAVSDAFSDPDPISHASTQRSPDRAQYTPRSTYTVPNFLDSSDFGFTTDDIEAENVVGVSKSRGRGKEFTEEEPFAWRKRG